MLDSLLVFVGFSLEKANFIRPHTFSMGFMSGLSPGQEGSSLMTLTVLIPLAPYVLLCHHASALALGLLLFPFLQTPEIRDFVQLNWRLQWT